MELVRKMLAGDSVALSQLITKVENDLIDIAEVMREIRSHLGHSYCVGITGPSGAGKSTLIEKLTTIIRERGFSTGMVMVDPTSPVSGGALLGDRIRLQRHYLDEGVFMRSMASRGKHGGLSKKVQVVVKLLDSFGEDFILVETTGVGQVETDITGIADTSILVLIPHAGDIIQAMKAGIIELADIFVINKADLGKADYLAVDLDSVLRQRKKRDNWTPPIIEAEAINNVHIEQIYEAIELHHQFLDKEGLFLQHRWKKEAKEFSSLVSEELLAQLVKSFKDSERFKTYLNKVESGEMDPYSACKEMLNNRQTWEALQGFSREV